MYYLFANLIEEEEEEQGEEAEEQGKKGSNFSPFFLRRERERGFCLVGMEKGEEKGENLGEKLKSEGFVVGKRGGQRTPILPYWRLLGAAAAASGPSSSSPAAHGVSYHSNFIELLPIPAPLSARKLAASLWELNHYRFPLSKMTHNAGSASLPRLRRLHHHQRHHPHDKPLLPDPNDSSPDLGSASTLRRHIAASLIQHHRSVERGNRAIQPVSPASFGSSMEVTPYNPAETPSSSLDFKDGGRAGYTLKTSTELLKVLNRIWSLEEQHAANMSMLKTMKRELEHASTRIKDLVREQQSDRTEIDGLRTRIEEDKLVRKNNEQFRQELEDERRLRKRSQSLHRKLARELHEVKSSTSKALKDIKSERRSRILLEDLCDEFALGIRVYEQEVHSFRQKSDKNRNRDRSILHLAESWIDERMQTKIGEGCSAVDKLRPEIETFLQSIRDRKGQNPRRTSLESIPLNAAISAPRAAVDDDSIGSDSHCFELNQPRTVSAKVEKKIPIPIPIPIEASEEGEGSKSSQLIADLIRNQHFGPESTRNTNPDWRTRASPIREWKPTLPSEDQEILESSSKLPAELKENSLKAKLIEARKRGKQRSRLKGSKVQL